jgi:hypothetical protein
MLKLYFHVTWLSGTFNGGLFIDNIRCTGQWQNAVKENFTGVWHDVCFHRNMAEWFLWSGSELIHWTSSGFLSTNYFRFTHNFWEVNMTELVKWPCAMFSLSQSRCFETEAVVRRDLQLSVLDPNHQKNFHIWWVMIFLTLHVWRRHAATPWCRIFLRKLIVTQLVKQPAFFMEPEGSLLCSLDPILR